MAAVKPTDEDLGTRDNPPKSFRAKWLVVGMFAKKEKERMSIDEMRAFVAARRMSTQDHFNMVMSNTSGAEGPDGVSDTARKMSINPLELVEEGSPCAICHQVIFDAYPCRSCSKVFHRHCLEHSGRYRQGDLHVLDLAQTSVGWSCYECDDIARLLTADEMQDLINEFDKYDINLDAGITQEEFLQVRREQHERDEQVAMTPDEEKDVLHEFRLIDTDGSGHIDWWEFVNHEAIKVLARRDKEELVKLLTPKEIHGAKSLFKTYDENDDGYVTEQEIKKTFRRWMDHFEDSVKQQQALRVRDNSHKMAGRTEAVEEGVSFEGHMDHGVRLIMDADVNNTGLITWEEFIMNQALYIICGRPNKSILGRR